MRVNMKLNSDSVAKIARFIDRCYELPEYTVCFYVEDEETSNYLGDYLFRYYKSIDREDEIVERCSGVSNQIFFKNKSNIQIFNRDIMVSHIRSNVAFIDSRLRENYVRESVFPILCEYRFNDKEAMINPKPIYIKFVEEE